MPSPWAAFLFLSTRHRAQTLIRSASPVPLHDTGQQARPQSRPTLHPRHSTQRPPESARSAARSTLLTRWTKVHPTAPLEPIQGSQKQKNAPNCNFFAIRNCCGEPKRVSRRKSAANQLIGSQFVLCTDKRESAIAKKLHGRRIICFRNGKITITGRILKRDADKRARIPLAGTDGERTPAPAATDIGRRCSGAVNGTRLAAQRAAATGRRQQRRRIYAS